MVVGICEVELLIPGARSLKEKRRILQSLIQRLQNHFNASVSEVDFLDLWQRSRVGMAVVSNDSAFAHKVLTRMVEFIEDEWEVEVIDVQMEML
jgi:hypothetical protein